MLAIMFSRMLHKIRSAAWRSWLKRLQSWAYAVLGSPRFFYVIAGLLVFQALWIALTARYPQAFDEQFHFGLIQLHAQQWLPFFTHQPSGAEVHGAVVRDPSYLYHYLLSLPYRLLIAWKVSLPLRIIILRLINIAMFVAGLFVYRALLVRIGLSRRLIHTGLLFFVLTPIIPLLAANINYDNFIFLLTAAFFLYAVRFMQTLERERRIDVAGLVLVLIYGVVAALAKYTSLPVTVATLVVMMWVTFRMFRRDEGAGPAVRVNWPKPFFVIISGIIIVALFGLALERYGINLVRYHSLSPDCAKVLSVKSCHSYAVWERDFEWAQIYPHPSLQGIVVYPFVWLHRMVFETMFTISSRFGAGGLVEYVPAPPMTVANYTAWVLVIGALVSATVFWRRLWRQHYLRYLLLISLFYALTLFGKNLSEYLHVGEGVAIHGRYLVPVYPVLYVAGALALGALFDRLHRPSLKITLVLVSLVLLSQGAGLITWIYRSDPSWYWSRGMHDLVYEINRPVQTIVHHILIP